jgi:hypothetical protein
MTHTATFHALHVQVWALNICLKVAREWESNGTKHEMAFEWVELCGDLNFKSNNSTLSDRYGKSSLARGNQPQKIGDFMPQDASEPPTQN